MAFPDIFPFFAKAGGYEYVRANSSLSRYYVSSSSASWMFDTQLLICRIIYDFKYVVHILQVRSYAENSFSLSQIHGQEMTLQEWYVAKGYCNAKTGHGR